MELLPVSVENLPLTQVLSKSRVNSALKRIGEFAAIVPLVEQKVYRLNLEGIKKPFATYSALQVKETSFVEKSWKSDKESANQFLRYVS
jgi:hypothetical protein